MTTKLVEAPQSTATQTVTALASIEGYDAPINDDYAFVAYKEVDADTGAWRVRIKGHRTPGAVFEPEAMRLNARSTGAQGKAFFTWGWSLDPTAGDPRQVQFRVHVKDGKPAAIEMFMLLRKGDGSADAPQSVSFPWPAGTPEGSTMPRTTVPARLADLECELELPAGFAEPPLPGGDVDFSDVSAMAPITLMASPVAAAFLTVSARPAYEDGSVMEWYSFLAGKFGISTLKLMPGHVGGRVHRHPAVLAEGEMEQDGTRLKLVLAAMEDGGRFLIVQAICPEELWPSYEAPLRTAVASFELARPRGSTVPLFPDTPIPTA